MPFVEIANPILHGLPPEGVEDPVNHISNREESALYKTHDPNTLRYHDPAGPPLTTGLPAYFDQVTWAHMSELQTRTKAVSKEMKKIFFMGTSLKVIGLLYARASASEI